MPYPAEFLQLEIKGKEKTMHVGKRMKGHVHLGGRKARRAARQDRRHKITKRQILNTRVKLYQFPRSVAEPGQYTFPFCVVLPEKIPGSMLFASVETKAMAFIKYVAPPSNINQGTL